MSVGTSDGQHFESEFDMLHQQIFAPEAKSPTDLTDKYNTPLTPEEQSTYNKRFSPRDSYDYDMQGWFKQFGNQSMEQGQHFPDTYKKPNHPTFSDQSMYHGVEGFQGGHWNELGENRYGFTPGQTNLEMHGSKNLQDYFKRIEPGNVLNPSEPKQIYFVRHGNTDLNTETGENSNDQPVRGWSSVSLNQEGRDHARKAAESVSDLPIEHIVASDLPRAAETARIIGNKLGVPVEYNSGLRTWDLGAYTEKAGKEIRDNVDRLCTTAQDERPPSSDKYKGESFNEFSHRILSTMSDIVQKHNDKEILVVSHNSPERVLSAWTEAGQPERSNA